MAAEQQWCRNCHARTHTHTHTRRFKQIHTDSHKCPHTHKCTQMHAPFACDQDLSNQASGVDLRHATRVRSEASGARRSQAESGCQRRHWLGIDDSRARPSGIGWLIIRCARQRM
ncbi:hypothetical protein GQ42DRAFT_70352 [Ramicandelaber brevisporus]|nr:hypothetical protein GQ42DRAFT_70352 [Ramicandelaber brevisporus]